MNQVHGLALDVFGVVRIIKRVENLHGDEHADGSRQANLLLRGRPEQGQAIEAVHESRAMKYWPLTSPKSVTCTILGWMSCAVSFASSMNIDTKVLSAARLAGCV